MYDLNDKKWGSHSKKNKLIKPRKPLKERLPVRKLVRLSFLLVVVALVIFVGTQLYAAIFKVALLKLEKIEVTNLSRLTREEVIAVAGVKPGDDLLRLSLRKVGENIEKNPWVERVQVRRYFPHTLAIEVKEREPVLIVNMGYLYYLDRKGEIFKPLTTGDRLDYPVLTGLTEERLAREAKGGKALLETAVGVLSLLESRVVLGPEDVSEIHVDDNLNFTLVTSSGGIAINLGRDGFMQKLERLSKIYKDLQPQMSGLSYIDLDYNDRIVVKKG